MTIELFIMFVAGCVLIPLLCFLKRFRLLGYKKHAGELKQLKTLKYELKTVLDDFDKLNMTPAKQVDTLVKYYDIDRKTAKKLIND